MTDKAKIRRPRGTPVKIPSWWWLMFTSKAKPYDDTTLANMANGADAERATPWDRTTIGKFRKGKNPTKELVDIFCEIFELDSPFFVAASKEEAFEFRAVQEKHRRIREKALADAIAARDAARAQIESVFTPDDLEAMQRDREDREAQARKQAEKNLIARKRREAQTDGE